MKVYLSTIAKNEFQYIKEFVQHHLKLGFDQVIIYDNNDQSGEHYEKILSQEIAENKVQLIDVRGRKNYQNLSYQDAYTKYKNEESWIFFLDVDEFLCLEHETDIHRFLERDCFSGFNQILFNWKTMSDNDLVRNDGRLLMIRFT